MLSVLLFILKIILIILAVLLGLIVIILSIILFVPINYKIAGIKEEEIVLNGKASWLFNCISFNAKYNKVLEYNLKLFWKTIFSSEIKNDYSKKDDIKPKIIKASDTKKKDIDDIDIKSDNIKSKNIKADDIKKEKRKYNAGKKNVFSKFKGIKKEKVKKEKVKKESFLDFIKKDVYKGVIRLVLSQMKKIVREILPKKANIRMEIGTGDPAITGYILGILSIFYMFSGNSMVIEPDFENKVFKGEFDLQGRIYIFIILFHLLKIILDKRVRKLISEYNT